MKVDHLSRATALPDGLADVASYPVLFAALLERGWSEAECAKVACRTVLRVLRAADEAAGVPA